MGAQATERGVTVDPYHLENRLKNFFIQNVLLLYARKLLDRYFSFSQYLSYRKVSILNYIEFC